MSEQKPIAQQIEERFSALLLGLELAKQLSLCEPNEDQPAFATDSDGRQLLMVEKVARRDKKLNQSSHQSFLDQLQDRIQDEILIRLDDRLQDTEHLYNKLLGVHENLPDILDVMSVRAASIGRLEPLVATVSWLSTDLIKMINMPKYRRTNSKGKVIPVDNLRVALSFLGLENLKMVIPSLVFRRWIPQITDPYPSIKTRLWEQAIGTGLACKKIAQVCQLDEGHAFTLGMFHEVGKLVLTRLYFRLFDEVVRDAVHEAHEARMKEEHSALTELTPSGTGLLAIYDKYAASVSSRLIKRMDFRRVCIAPAMEEFAANLPVREMSPMGKVLRQGDAYNKYRMLKTYRLINMDEAKMYLRDLMMPAGALSLLKATDLRHLNLTFDEDQEAS
ncbi:HDOD domain-containing protein [Bowmanella dokdonensis]|uniref:HDOD domain-containing protein n=1 Tax=Bowmanella dokdonensis TaxID=751969 RepID=A0A939DJJ8_9ALTE|nr:HDOD domain-containing protein [Bowmanella dokdonensis]MBN7823822.1 HDOD domain-containing protein [Bowmanella dokdonensis]